LFVNVLQVLIYRSILLAVAYGPWPCKFVRNARSQIDGPLVTSVIYPHALNALASVQYLLMCYYMSRTAEDRIFNDSRFDLPASRRLFSPGALATSPHSCVGGRHTAEAVPFPMTPYFLATQVG